VTRLPRFFVAKSKLLPPQLLLSLLIHFPIHGFLKGFVSLPFCGIKGFTDTFLGTVSAMSWVLIMVSCSVFGPKAFTHPLKGLAKPSVNSITNTYSEMSITIATILWNSIMYASGVLVVRILVSYGSCNPFKFSVNNYFNHNYNSKSRSQEEDPYTSTQEVSWETLLNKGRKPSQSFAIFLKRKTSHTITKTSTQEGVAILIISYHNF
jgi:hypothetical protein